MRHAIFKPVPVPGYGEREAQEHADPSKFSTLREEISAL